VIFKVSGAASPNGVANSVSEKALKVKKLRG